MAREGTVKPRTELHPGGTACLAFMAVLALLALGPRSATIRGTVTTIDTGESLPKVEVTATSKGVRHTVYTDEAGRYSLPGLPGGRYELSARLPGFRAPRRTDVEVPVAGTLVVDFEMKYGMLSNMTWMAPGLGEAYRSADAVVHVRIKGSLPARPWPSARPHGGGTVGTEHQAFVLDVVKVDPVHGPIGSEVRFVQYPAGTWSDGTESVEGNETPYSPGEKYVAFLEWHAESGRFTRVAGPSFMFSVRDGGVFWEGEWLSDVPGLRSGMTVESFFAILRGLPRENGR